MSCYGGRPAMDEHRTMKSLNPQVIIGTPGRMNDHLNKGNIVARGKYKEILTIAGVTKSEKSVISSV